MPPRPRNPRLVPLTRLRIDGGTQARATLDNAAIEEYAAAFSEGARFPPVDVVDDGTTLWLVDGFHRYHAAAMAEEESLLANVTNGTHIDAVLRAAGANTTHGIRRTNQDKRRAIVMVCALFPEKSDREIARICGVTHPLVASVRGDAVQAEIEAAEEDEPEIPLAQPEPDSSPARQTEMTTAREGINAAMRLIKETRRQIVALCSSPAGGFINQAAVDSDLSNALAALRGSMPSRACPICYGSGCRTCRNLGWVSRMVDEHAMPAEFAEGGSAQ